MLHNLADHPRDDVGLDAYGRQFRIPLHSQTLLIAGVPGSGKSVALLNFLRVLSTSNARIFVVDMKPYAPGLAPYAARAEQVIDTQHAAFDLFTSLLAEGQRRYKLLQEHRIDKAPTDGELAAEFPPICVVIDEAADLLGQGTPYDKILNDLLRRLVQRDRAVAFSLILGMQKPSAQLIDSNLRSLFGWRICFRHDESSSHMTLGDELPKDVTPWKIKPTVEGKGMCFASSEHGGFIKARFRNLDMPTAWNIGEDTATMYNNWLAGYTPVLPTVDIPHPTANNGKPLCPCVKCEATCQCDSCNPTVPVPELATDDSQLWAEVEEALTGKQEAGGENNEHI